jgi:hypothetical protein
MTILNFERAIEWAGEWEGPAREKWLKEIRAVDGVAARHR